MTHKTRMEQIKNSFYGVPLENMANKQNTGISRKRTPHIQVQKHLKAILEMPSILTQQAPDSAAHAGI